MRGVGTNFTGGGVVALTVTSGGTASYSVKVVNTGDTAAQFRLVTFTRTDLNPATVTMSSGPFGTTIVKGADGWSTPVIAAGQFAVITMKVTPSQLATSGDYISQTELQLHATDGTALQQAEVFTNVKPPLRGATPNEVYIRNGLQPWVGGPFGLQAMSSPNVAPGAKVTFTLRLQNDSTSPSRIRLRLFHEVLGDPACTFLNTVFVGTLQDGSTDVTTLAEDGTYVTPNLPVGSHRDLVLTVAYATPTTGCGAMVYSVTSSDASGTTSMERSVAALVARVN